MDLKEKPHFLSKFIFNLSLLYYEWRLGRAIEPHMYYGKCLISARFVPDEENSSKSTSSTSDPTSLIPETKPYTVWFDVYEMTSKELSPSDKYWIEIQFGEWIFPLKENMDDKLFSKYSDPLQRFIWKNSRYKAYKEVLLSENNL